MSNLEKLAVAQALYKRLAELVSTKDKHSLRGQVDAELLEAYDSHGQDRIEVRVGSIPVGTLSVRKSKALNVKRLVVKDLKQFEDWGIRTGQARPITRLEWDADQDTILAQAFALGEIPDGCAVVEVNEPARVLGTTLKVDESAVVAALRALGTTATAFLERVTDGGDE